MVKGKVRKGKVRKVDSIKREPSFKKVTTNVGQVRGKQGIKYYDLKTGKELEPRVVQLRVKVKAKRLNHEKQVQFWMKGLYRETLKNKKLARELVEHQLRKGRVKGYGLQDGKLVRVEKVKVDGKTTKKFVGVSEREAGQVTKRILHNFVHKDTKDKYHGEARKLVEQTFKDSGPRKTRGGKRERKSPPPGFGLAAADLALFDKWLIVNSRRMYGFLLDMGFAEHWREIGT